MSQASLFPALEKACPKHRNMMNVLYHKRYASLDSIPLNMLSEEEIDRVIDAVAAHEHPRTLPERIIRQCYKTRIDCFSPDLSPQRMLALVRKEPNLPYVALNVFRFRKEMLDFFQSPNLSPEMLFNNIDRCVGVSNQPNIRKIFLVFDDDTAAVTAKLRLSEFSYE